jgi:hypothetical protein
VPEENEMKRPNRDIEGRRSVITGLGVAAAGLTLGATSAHAQTARGGFRPARDRQDAWMDELPGDHRVFIDSASPEGGASALLYANNLYDAQTNAYSGGPADFAMLVCFRHFSTPFGYSDAVWKKYGEQFRAITGFADPDTGEAPMVNLMNSDRSTLPNFGITIDSLAAKGTQFAICNAATHFLADQLAQEAGVSSDDVYAELIAEPIPNSRFVSAGVMATTRAQEYGYSLLYAG